MIDQVDSTIAAFLKNELPAELAARVAVTFAALDGNFPPAAYAVPAVNFSLYAISENTSHRSSSPILQRLANGAATKARPPVYLDCSYLVTVWTDAATAGSIAEEHALLGAVTKVLLAHAVLPTDALQGSLQSKDASTQPLPVAAGLSNGDFRSPSEVWQALGGRQKLFLNYKVTFAMPVFDPEAVTVVSEKQIRFRTLEEVPTP